MTGQFGGRGAASAAPGTNSPDPRCAAPPPPPGGRHASAHCSGDASGCAESSRNVPSAGAASSARFAFHCASASAGAIHSPPWSSPSSTRGASPSGSSARKNCVSKPPGRNGGDCQRPAGTKSRASSTSACAFANEAKPSPSPASSARLASSRASCGTLRAPRASSTPHSSKTSRAAAAIMVAASPSAPSTFVAASARSARPPGNAWKPPRN